MSLVPPGCKCVLYFHGSFWGWFSASQKPIFRSLDRPHWRKSTRKMSQEFHSFPKSKRRRRIPCPVLFCYGGCDVVPFMGLRTLLQFLMRGLIRQDADTMNSRRIQEVGVPISTRFVYLLMLISLKKNCGIWQKEGLLNRFTPTWC